VGICWRGFKIVRRDVLDRRREIEGKAAKKVGNKIGLSSPSLTLALLVCDPGTKHIDELAKYYACCLKFVLNG
jgi:hypothetical protein